MNQNVGNNEVIIFKAKKMPAILSLLFAIGFISFAIFIDTMHVINEEAEINGINIISYICGIILLLMIYFLSRNVLLTPEYLKIGIKTIPWEIVMRIRDRNNSNVTDSNNTSRSDYGSFRELFVQFHEKNAEHDNSRTIKPKNYINGSILAETVITQYEKYKSGKIKETVE